MKELTRGEKIMQEVKALLADEEKKRNSCPLPHDYSIPVDRQTRLPIPERRIFCKWQCTKCGSIEDGTNVHWYKLGLQHATK